MTYRGVVKNGKVELEPPVELPDGTVVDVEVAIDRWLEDWKKLVEEVSDSTPPGVSIVEELIRSRK